MPFCWQCPTCEILMTVDRALTDSCCQDPRPEDCPLPVPGLLESLREKIAEARARPATPALKSLVQALARQAVQEMIEESQKGRTDE
jgi:hypothetical protein